MYVSTKCAVGTLVVIGLCSFVFGFSSPIVAKTLLFDDFNDGNSTDGSPEIWDPVVPQFPGSYNASSGDFQLVPPVGGATFDFLAAIARGFTASDVSIRAQVRKLNDTPVDGEWVGIIARLNPITPSLNAEEYSHYEAYLQRNGDLVIVNRHGAVMPNIELGRANVGLDVTTEDVLLQFDLFGSTLSARAWRLGEPMPSNAQVRVTNSAYASGGIALTSTDGTNNSIGVFRFVHVADASIPEPSIALMIIPVGIAVTTGRRSRRGRWTNDFVT